MIITSDPGLWGSTQCTTELQFTPTLRRRSSGEWWHSPLFVPVAVGTGTGVSLMHNRITGCTVFIRQPSVTIRVTLGYTMVNQARTSPALSILSSKQGCSPVSSVFKIEDSTSKPWVHQSNVRKWGCNLCFRKKKLAELSNVSNGLLYQSLQKSWPQALPHGQHDFI